MMIATWNVNSIRSRLTHVTDWVVEHKPDVLLLQELKSTEFPAEEFEKLGYQTELIGQKAYNGVATISRHPIEMVSNKLAGDDNDVQARYLETNILDLRIINIYLPNGNPIGTEKFAYKLAWMDRLKKRMTALKRAQTPVIIGGDYNVIPEDIDCFSTKYWKNNALFQSEPREMFRSYLKMGYVDVFRYFNDEPGQYTFWEYFRHMFDKNQGIRIDHFLVSPLLENRLDGCVIDKGPRAREKSSDHTPIIMAIK